MEYVPMTEAEIRDWTNNARMVPALRQGMLALFERLDAAQKVCEGFDAGVFVRDIRNDSEPGWAIKAFPHLRALGQLVAAVDKAEGQVEKVEAAKS